MIFMREQARGSGVQSQKAGTKITPGAWSSRPFRAPDKRQYLSLFENREKGQGREGIFRVGPACA
jgi:hypothetical protein